MNVDLGLGPLKQTDYPQVRFWYGEDWTNFCANNQALLGGSGQSQLGVNHAEFIEDQHGITMDAFSTSMIQSLAKAIWIGLGTIGVAPSTWEEADDKTRGGYYCAMSAGFFEFRLCDSNWKAEKVATDMYHLWFSSWNLQIRTHPPALDRKRVRNASVYAGAQKKLRKAAVSNILFTDNTSGRLRPLPRFLTRPRGCDRGCPTPQGNASLNPKVTALMFVSRNLCATDWCREVGGTSFEFNQYFLKLPPTTLEVSKFGLYLQHDLTNLHPRNT